MSNESDNSKSSNDSDGLVFIDSKDSDTQDKVEEITKDMQTGKIINVTFTLNDPSIAYLMKRLERIKRNNERLLSLQLIHGDGSPTLQPSPTSCINTHAQRTPNASSSTSTRRKTPNSFSSSTSLSKSPRLAASLLANTLDLTNHPPQEPSLAVTTNSEALVESDGGTGQQPMARRCLYSSKLAKRNHTIKEQRIMAKTEKIEKLSVIYPTKLKTIKFDRGGTLKESEHNKFLQAIDAFVRHHAEYNCCNYQKKSYCTQCSCLSALLGGDNSEFKFKQVNQSLLEFYTRTSYTQKSVFKEWLRYGEVNAPKNVKNNSSQVIFLLPGVYHGAAHQPPGVAAQCKKQFSVCINALSLLFNYSYHKMCLLRRDIVIPGIKVHGNMSKIKNCGENKMFIDASLISFFENFKGEAETHSTRVICQETGVGLRDEEIDTVELPSSYSKRRLYYKYCFNRGYVLKADAKGKIPAVKNYPLRDFNNDDWPIGSRPLPVCAWITFRRFWKANYPKMKIRPPSRDTCVECWKFKNKLVVTSCLQNEVSRQARRLMLNRQEGIDHGESVVCSLCGSLLVESAVPPLLEEEKKELLSSTLESNICSAALFYMRIIKERWVNFEKETPHSMPITNLECLAMRFMGMLSCDKTRDYKNDPNEGDNEKRYYKNKPNVRDSDSIVDNLATNEDATCRGIVSRYTKEWEVTTKRLGRWIDFENDYMTMDPNFMEIVW